MSVKEEIATNKPIQDMTPTAFEEYCLQVLEQYANEEGLQDFKITHNKIISVADGKYQIDIYASFLALGVRIKVICECKKYTESINREKVVVLADKIRSLGAHKGILLATSSFQSGAVQYAEEHGIALIQVKNSPMTPGKKPTNVLHIISAHRKSVWSHEDISLLERELGSIKDINLYDKTGRIIKLDFTKFLEE